MNPMGLEGQSTEYVLVNLRGYVRSFIAALIRRLSEARNSANLYTTKFNVAAAANGISAALAILYTCQPSIRRVGYFLSSTP